MIFLKKHTTFGGGTQVIDIIIDPGHGRWGHTSLIGEFTPNIDGILQRVFVAIRSATNFVGIVGLCIIEIQVRRIDDDIEWGSCKNATIQFLRLELNWK